MYVQSNVINTCWLKMKFSALTETDLGMQFAAEDVASVWWSLSHKAQTVAAALRSRSHLLNFFLVWFSSSFVMRRGSVTQHAEARNLTCRLAAWWFQGESSSNICSHSLLLPVYMNFSTFTSYLKYISNLKNENPYYLCCINETMSSKTSGNPCHRHLPKLTSTCSQVVFWPGLQQTSGQSPCSASI